MRQGSCSTACRQRRARRRTDRTPPSDRAAKVARVTRVTCDDALVDRQETQGYGQRGLAVSGMLEHEGADALVRQGQEAGFLTTEEISLVLDELGLEPGQMDD